MPAMTDDDKALCEALGEIALDQAGKEYVLQHPAFRGGTRIRELSAELKCVQSECLEQARIIGIATERELALSAELDTVTKLARDMAEALKVATEVMGDEGYGISEERAILTRWKEHEGKQP